MLEELFFATGLINNIALIFIFSVRKGKLELLRRYGSAYLLLAVPAVYGIVLVQQEQKTIQYGIFLALFLAFLTLEALYDFVLKIPFRESGNWKQLAPYISLYFAMNYGFVVMVWKNNLLGGLVMATLFAVQIIINAITHPPRAKPKKN